MKTFYLLFGILLFIICLLCLFVNVKNNIEHFSNSIEFVNWWGDGDEVSKNIFDELFSNTKQNKIKVYSVFGEPNFTREKDTLYVQYSGESYYHNPDLFDINFIPTDNVAKNIINFPYAYYYILYKNLDINKLLEPRKINKKEKKFCLFLVSNGNCEQRNEIFNRLMEYKKVDSPGKFMNNMNETCPANVTSPEYHNFISKYKFMICCENISKPNYFTEKLINGYYNETIPIYWGCSNISDYVNMDAILHLPPDYSNSELNELLNKIKYLDANESAYKKMYEKSFFKNGKIPDEFNIEKIKTKINNVLKN